MHHVKLSLRLSYKVKREAYKTDYIVTVISTKRKKYVCLHFYIYMHVCICFQIYRLFLEVYTRNRASKIVFENANRVEAEI